MVNVFLCVRTFLSTCIIQFDSHNKFVKALLITGLLSDEERPEKTYQLDLKTTFKKQQARGESPLVTNILIYYWDLVIQKKHSKKSIKHANSTYINMQKSDYN